MSGWMVGVSAKDSTNDDVVRHWFIVHEADRVQAERAAQRFAEATYTLAEPVDGYDAVAALAPITEETLDAMGVPVSGVKFSGTALPPRFIGA